MPETIRYRLATEEDCLALARLKRQVWNTTYRGIYPDATLDGYDVEKNRLILQTIVASPEIDLYMAEHGERPIALMTCGKPFRPVEPYRQEVGMLYVLREYQRQGVGKQLLSIAAEQARSRGFDAYVVSVNRLNLPAIAFYRALGGQLIHEDERQLRFAMDATLR